MKAIEWVRFFTCQRERHGKNVFTVAEQALCDLLYLLRRRGLDPRSLYTFRNLDRIAMSPVLLGRYPITVQRAARAMLASP